MRSSPQSPGTFSTARLKLFPLLFFIFLFVGEGGGGAGRQRTQEHSCLSLLCYLPTKPSISTPIGATLAAKNIERRRVIIIDRYQITDSGKSLIITEIRRDSCCLSAHLVTFYEDKQVNFPSKSLNILQYERYVVQP
jgi:hypothetical protein